MPKTQTVYDLIGAPPPTTQTGPYGGGGALEQAAGKVLQHDPLLGPLLRPGVEQWGAKTPVGKALKGKLEKTPMGRAAINFAKVPSEALLGVVGAGERYNSEALADYLTNPKGVSWSYASAALGGPLGQAVAALDPDTRKAFIKQWSAAMNPYTDAEERSETATGFRTMLQKLPPNFWGKLGVAGARILFQSLKDPTTFMNPETGGEAGLKLATKGVDALINTESKHPLAQVGRTIARTVATNVPERSKRVVHGVEQPALDPKTIAGVNTAREKGINWRAKQDADLEALLDKYRPKLERTDAAMKGGAESFITGKGLNFQRFPYELRQRLQQFGVSIPPVEQTLFDLEKGAKPRTLEQELRERVSESLDLKQRGVVRDAMHKYVKNLPPQEIERLSALGSPMQVKVQEQIKKWFPNLSDQQATELARRATKFITPGLKLGQAMSRAQVEALLATGFPHIRNVSVAGFLALGERGMARAAYFMGKGTPHDLVSRLEEGGAAHFALSEPKTALGKAAARVPGLRKFTTGTLDKADTAIRAARLEDLDRLHGPKSADPWTEAQKLDRVNEDIGRYHVKSQLIEWAQSVGGNFPQWHGYNVPMMTARAAARYPGRLARYGRYQQQMNDTFWPDSPYYTLFGGPPDEAMSAAADPARMLFAHRYPSYFGGSSMLGPILSLPLQFMYGDTKTNLESAAAGFAPFGNITSDVLLNPYKSPWSAAGRGVGSGAGLYTQKRTGPMRERAQRMKITSSAPAAGAKTTGKTKTVYDLIGVPPP